MKSLPGMPIWIIFLVPILASAFAQGPAFAEVFTQEKCSLCHILESRFLDSDPALSSQLRAEGENRVCFSCHNVTVVDDRDTLWTGSQHPPPRGKKGPCSACHSPHGSAGWKVLAGTAIPLQKGGNALCLSCHKSYGPGSGAIHKARFPEGGCQECHKAHGGTGSSLLKGVEEQLCLRCHIAMDSALRGGHSWKTVSGKGNASPPPCTSCHPVHKKESKDASRSAICGRCHPSQLVPSSDKSTIHPGVVECLTCHTVHTRAEETGRAFRGGDMQPVLLCGKCHPGYIAETKEKTRERGTHSLLAEGKGICLRCHRIHSPAPRTSLLATDKPYFCLDCHQEQNTIVQSGEVVLAHPIFEHIGRREPTEAEKGKRVLLGPQGELVCLTCHLLHRSEPGTPLLPKGGRGEEMCRMCHPKKSRLEHRSKPDGKINASCNDCHSVHGQRERKTAEKTDRLRGRESDPWARVCHKCHKEKSRHLPGREDRTISRGMGLPSFDLQGRRADATGGISCPTCHDPHGTPAGGNRLRRPYEPSGFLCTSCHAKEETIALTPHDLRGVAGKGPCDPCHVPHGGTSPWIWGFPRGGGELGEEACSRCHEGKGIGTPVPKGGHPRNMIPSRLLPARYPLVGPGGAASKTGVISCPTCHAVHGTGIMPMGQGVGKLLRLNPGEDSQGACAACHGGKSLRHGKAGCLDCHPPHSEKGADTACGRCHGEGKGALFAKHDAAGKGCRSCHRIHEGGTAGNGRQGYSGSEKCYGCHPAASRIAGSPHAELGTSECGPCHPVHGETPKFEIRPKLGEELFQPDLACIRCHREGGDATIPPWGSHPNHRKEVSTTYGAKVILETPVTMISKHKEGGKPVFPLFDEVGKPAMTGRIGCLTCHDPHAGGKAGEGVAPAKYQRDPGKVFLSDICATCHRGDALKKLNEFHTGPRKET